MAALFCDFAALIAGSRFTSASSIYFVNDVPNGKLRSFTGRADGSSAQPFAASVTRAAPTTASHVSFDRKGVGRRVAESRWGGALQIPLLLEELLQVHHLPAGDGH